MWISRTQALITRILFRLRREILSVFVLQQVFEICFAGKSLHSCLLVQCQTQARLKAFNDNLMKFKSSTLNLI